MTAATVPAPVASELDSMTPAEDAAWEEFQGMTLDECRAALGYLAGYDPEAFVRVLDLSRSLRDRGREVTR